MAVPDPRESRWFTQGTRHCIESNLPFKQAPPPYLSLSLSPSLSLPLSLSPSLSPFLCYLIWGTGKMKDATMPPPPPTNTHTQTPPLCDAKQTDPESVPSMLLSFYNTLTCVTIVCICVSLNTMETFKTDTTQRNGIRFINNTYFDSQTTSEQLALGSPLVWAHKTN